MMNLELTKEALDYVLLRQSDYKREKATGQYSQTQTIDRIIVEHKKLKEEVDTLKKLLLEKQNTHST